jgi:hypothetical protein
VKRIIFTLVKDILLFVIYNANYIQQHLVEQQFGGHDFTFIFRIEDPVSIVRMIEDNSVHSKVLLKLPEENCSTQGWKPLLLKFMSRGGI